MILLTAQGEEADRIIGLREARTTMSSSHSPRGELVARVEAVLRRFDGASASASVHGQVPALRFEGLRIEPATRRVLLDEHGRTGAGSTIDARPATGAGSTIDARSATDAGSALADGSAAGDDRGAPPGERAVALTAREFDLLAFLARHPGPVFSRDRLMELVWQLPDYSDSSTVTVHIRRLRAKLKPDPERPRYIQTVWGVGSRFQP